MKGLTVFFFFLKNLESIICLNQAVHKTLFIVTLKFKYYFICGSVILTNSNKKIKINRYPILIDINIMNIKFIYFLHLTYSYVYILVKLYKINNII